MKKILKEQYLKQSQQSIQNTSINISNTTSSSNISQEGTSFPTNQELASETRFCGLCLIAKQDFNICAKCRNVRLLYICMFII